MSSKRWKSAAAAIGVLCGARQSLANPQYVPEPVTSTLLSDNFSQGFGNWNIDTNTIATTTVFGQTPTLVTGAAGAVPTYIEMKVDTYNPAKNQAGVTFSGTELSSKLLYALPTSGGVTTGQGIQYQVMGRIEPTGLLGPAGKAGDTSIAIPEGLCAANFAYGYSDNNPNYLNEIDYENLTSQQSVPTVNNPTGATTHSNTYFTTSNGDATLLTSYAGKSNTTKDNSYYAQTPYAPGDTGSTATPIDIYQWHTYDIDWYPGQIDWYVDGQLVREEADGETSTTNPTLYIPSITMGFDLNFWVPASGNKDAYSAAIAPATTAALNEEFTYDLANASISTIAAVGTPVPVPEPSSMPGLVGVVGTAMMYGSRQRLI